METKSSIRKQSLALRNAMNPEECIFKSKNIMQNILLLSQVKKADYILCYAGYKSEVMTNDLIKELLKMGKQVYLPRVSGDEMDFYRISELSQLTEGYKGIPEPEKDCTDLFTKELWEQNREKAVMFLPGAAFSKTGARIGYGKGYYDRYLERIFCEERIALCYELQIVESIPVDEHDIPVTTIVTEEKIRHIIKTNEYRQYFI